MQNIASHRHARGAFRIDVARYQAKSGERRHAAHHRNGIAAQAVRLAYMRHA